jgi:hypothetical protein
MKNKILNYMIIASTVLILFTAPAKCQRQDSVTVRKTNPTGALFRSTFVPGWGQFYNRKYIKSAVIAGIEIYLINEVYANARKASLHKDHFTSAVSDTAYRDAEFARYEKALDKRGNASWFLAATIFFSMFDAYVDAHLSDFDQTDKAFDVYIGPGRDEDIKAVITFNLP